MPSLFQAHQQLIEQNQLPTALHQKLQQQTNLQINTNEHKPSIYLARIPCINPASISVKEAFLLSTQHSTSKSPCMYPAFISLKEALFSLTNLYFRRILCIHPTSSINLIML